MSHGYTQILADYLSALKFEDIPEEVTERAKMLTMHVIGAAIAAKDTKMGMDAMDIASGSMDGGALRATVWGSGKQIAYMGAAFANGTMADVLDWEDCSWTGHPSAGAVPAAVAAAEAMHISGKEYLTALIGGYDVYQRIAMAVQPKYSDQEKGYGWGLTSWQIFAAAMPVAKMFGFSGERMNQAIGMTATLTPVPICGTHDTRSDAYHYHHGFTARDGIAGCEVVEKGIATLQNLLECGTGYCGAVRGDEAREEWYTKDLGEKYLIMETLFKHWPANMWIQVPLDQLDDLVTHNNIKAEDIESITITPNIYTRMTFHPEGFDSLVDAQFSIPYCLAMYFYEKPSAKWAAADYLKNAELLKLASKVHTTEDCERLMFPFPYFQKGSFPLYTMQIDLKDGRRFFDERRFPKGHPREPFTFEEEAELFKVMTAAAFSPEKQNRFIEFFRDLENTGDMSVLGEIFKS